MNVCASSPDAYSESQDSAQNEVSRTDIGLRVIYTAVFAFILNLAAGALTLLVVVQLVAALVTCRAPHPRLTQLGTSVISYCALITRYITFGEKEPPFPFADFPRSTPDA